jgi:hypothetical protein
MITIHSTVPRLRVHVTLNLSAEYLSFEGDSLTVLTEIWDVNSLILNPHSRPPFLVLLWLEPQLRLYRR